jgi:hypothetical protein
VDFSQPFNRKASNDIFIGDKAEQYKRTSRGLTNEKITHFYTCVVKFYSAACKYIKEKFPLSDELLVQAQVADISLRSTATFSALRFFLDKFPCILETAQCSVDVVQVEFCDYQVEQFSEEIMGMERVDSSQWVAIGKLRNAAGRPRFENLSAVMAAVLVIPHSNCDCERVLSTVRKNKTDFRGSMKPGSLQHLLQV